jgi:hypothetical protein
MFFFIPSNNTPRRTTLVGVLFKHFEKFRESRFFGPSRIQRLGAIFEGKQ